MEFFGIGIWEVLFILVVALIIWGPGRIVEIGTKLGKIARTLKRASFDLTAQVTKELEVEEKKRSTLARGKQQHNRGGGNRGKDKTSL